MLHTWINLALLCFSVVIAPVTPASSIEDLSTPGSSISTIKDVSKTLPNPRSLSIDLRNENFAEINGVEIYYADFGKRESKKLPVLFLHGGYLNSDYFGDVIHKLPADRRIIAMDVRGHGRSGLDDQKFSYELFAKDATALLSKLGIPKAAFVGWGFSAVATLEAMLLEETKGFVGGAFLWGGYHNLAARNMVWTKSDAFYKKVADRVAFDIWKYRSNAYLEVFSQKFADFDRQGPKYTEQDLQAIDLGNKVTVAFGEREELVRHEEFEILAKMIDGSKSVIVPGVSHYGPIQNPDALAVEIHKFLEQL